MGSASSIPEERRPIQQDQGSRYQQPPAQLPYHQAPHVNQPHLTVITHHMPAQMAHQGQYNPVTHQMMNYQTHPQMIAPQVPPQTMNPHFHPQMQAVPEAGTLQGGTVPVQSTFDQTEHQSTSRHVGLENRTGENNCFLNATIQALWHLNIFREKVLFEPGQSDSSMDTLSAISSLFSQYQFTEEMCIPSTEIRYILSQLDESGRFALGDIADAAETLDALLTHIHASHVAKICSTTSPEKRPNDFCHGGSAKCISHVIFGGVFVSQSSCQRCGATNEPSIIEPYFHFASVMSIVEESTSRPGVSFGHLLNFSFRCAGLGCPSLDNRPLSVRGRRLGRIPGRCSGKANTDLSCLESPMVLAISLAWPSDNVASHIVERFINLMEGHVWLSEVFFSGSTEREGRVPSAPPLPLSTEDTRSTSEMYSFRGFVCFYGKHYISIFKEWNPSNNHSEYLLFDDARIRLDASDMYRTLISINMTLYVVVRRLGQWENVKTECIRARYQPVLLLYEKKISPDQPNSHK